MDKTQIDRLIYQHTGIREDQFPDEYEGQYKLCKAVIAEMDAESQMCLHLTVDENASVAALAAAPSAAQQCQYPNCGCTSRATCTFNYAAPSAAPTIPVGEIIANDPVHGWHMRALVDWEAIGAGTKLYTHPAPSAAPGDAQTAEVMRILADHGIGMCDGETVYPHEGEDAEQYMGAIRSIVARFAAAPAAPQQEAPRAALPAPIEAGIHDAIANGTGMVQVNADGSTKHIRHEDTRAALPEDVDQRFSLFCRECDKLPAQCRCK
jgi:hypothetical protein